MSAFVFPACSTPPLFFIPISINRPVRAPQVSIIPMPRPKPSAILYISSSLTPNSPQNAHATACVQLYPFYGIPGQVLFCHSFSLLIHTKHSAYHQVPNIRKKNPCGVLFYRSCLLVCSVSIFSLFFRYSSIPFCSCFSCTHCENNCCSASYSISAGIYAFFGGLSTFFLCNDTFSAIYFQAFFGRRNQWVWRSSRDMITVSTSMSYSDPGISTGRLLPDASGSPSSILMTVMLLTFPFSSTLIRFGFVRRSKIAPSSFA